MIDKIIDTNIDTHKFSIVSNNITMLSDDIQDILNILDNNNVNIYNKYNISIQDIPNRIRDNTSKYWVYNFKVLINNNDWLISISIYKATYGGYIISFNFYGLTQYNRHTYTLTDKSIKKRDIRDDILLWCIDEDIDITHRRIDLCIDIDDVSYDNVYDSYTESGDVEVC